ncbi:MAG: hypothetical protein H7210_13615 [Pyrinomonadaceae bacterium]|nr:hypothetical protein [Phycisphaerales bacterium]
MSKPQPDEFYVGYEAKSPPGIAARTRTCVIVYVVLSMLVATACVTFIARTGKGQWMDSSFKSFTGVVRESPYPMIELDQPIFDGASRTALLVDFGKRGAQKRVEGFENLHVVVTGTVLERNGRCMIELAPEEGAVRRDPVEGGGSPVVPLQDVQMDGRGMISLQGEIVDPKCFLGAMKPGEGKTHKDCAVRCISGGIPPSLVCWSEDGSVTYYVLTDETGHAAHELFLDVVGEPVEVRGEVGRIGDLMVLRVSPGGVRRL